MAEHLTRPRGRPFCKGQSGNPNGRPKKSKNLATIMKDELSETVRVTEQGRARTLTKREVMIKRLVAEAMKGSPRHISFVLAHDPLASEMLAEISEGFSHPADAEVQAELLRRLRTAAGMPEATADETGEQGDASDSDRDEE